MVCNLSICIGIIIFDLTGQVIWGLFVLLYAANWINFLGFNILIRNIKLPGGIFLRHKTTPFFITMNVVYLANGCCAFIKWYGPFCDQSQIYPPCMTVASGLYLVNACYHFYLHKNDYYLTWTELEAAEKKVEGDILDKFVAQA